MKGEKEILGQVIQEAQKIEIPQSLQPENMRKRLEENAQIKDKAERNRNGMKKRTIYPKTALLAAACMLLLVSAALVGQRSALGRKSSTDTAADLAGASNREKEEAGEGAWGAEVTEALPEDMAFGEASYEEIYQSMLTQWEKQYSSPDRQKVSLTGSEAAADVSADGAEVRFAQTGRMEEGDAKAESASTSEAVKDLAAGLDYGTTNIQTPGVEEGDIIKNDGRYLYQIMNVQTENGRKQFIQIVDTLDGLTQVSRLEGFEGIQEFYVEEGRIIVIENKYNLFIGYSSSADYSSSAQKRAATANAYHEISFYDIQDITKPRLMKKFTLEGEYASSRIADGYFYGFSRYYAVPGEGEEDYQAYIPQVEGKLLEAGDILLPEESRGVSYLVFVSVALNDPTEFVQTRAVVSSSEMYYVSGENIYIASFKNAAEKEGWSSTTTDILKFSYGEGEFALKARGSIKGQLESSFSLDEYEGHLRAVTTVRDYRMRELTDDRTGSHIGYEVLEEKQTNSLYVLDKDLKVTGSIEGLAENERIYSARFFGKTGYFVTFRQMDPLYAVDLSDPAAPKILSELKISGFSEYLHVYGTDRLLGIGMEADENTGIQEGMKLSMFDISDPANVQEVSKLALDKYDYSEALFNHKSVLISPEANILGFEAQGSEGGYRKKYLVFSYDDEKDVFIKEMELGEADADGNVAEMRGTFIGDVFYLLSDDGSVISYDLTTGEKLDSLNPQK